MADKLLSWQAAHRNAENEMVEVVRSLNERLTDMEAEVIKLAAQVESLIAVRERPRPADDPAASPLERIVSSQQEQLVQHGEQLIRLSQLLTQLRAPVSGDTMAHIEIANMYRTMLDQQVWHVALSARYEEGSASDDSAVAFFANRLLDMMFGNDEPMPLAEVHQRLATFRISVDNRLLSNLLETVQRLRDTARETGADHKWSFEPPADEVELWPGSAQGGPQHVVVSPGYVVNAGGEEKWYAKARVYYYTSPDEARPASPTQAAPMDEPPAEPPSATRPAAEASSPAGPTGPRSAVGRGPVPHRH